MTRAPGWRRVAQIVLVAAALFVLAGLLRREWPRLREVPIAPDAALLAAATITWVVAFALLAGAWARSLGWWGDRLRSRDALRIFFLSNLARYIPGAIWQFAGLAALTSGAGVSPLRATAAVLLQQLVLLGTGLVLAIMLSPEFLGPAIGGSMTSTPAPWRIAAALALLALFTMILPRSMPLVRRGLQRFARRDLVVPRMSSLDFAGHVGVAAVALVLYGLSFWLFGRGVLGAAAPILWLAVAAYVAAYVVGILAVFAPGGIGFREGALTAALAPAIGLERALFLALGARLWQIGIEVLGALVSLAFPGPMLSGRGAPGRAGSAEGARTSAAAPPGEGGPAADGGS